MKTIYLFLCICFLYSCQKQQITDTKDYSIIPVNQNTITNKQSKKDLAFWNSRIKNDSMQIISLGKSAQQYTNLFQTTGNIENLKKAEITLQKAVQKAAIGKDGYLRSLAQNLISQHRFKEAQQALKNAEKIDKGKRATQLMQFDVAMELGNYKSAQNYLEKLTDFSDFNYLIRLAKWKDYTGDLDATIHFMERAMAIVNRSKNKELQLWTYTNLADYYGHAGRIKDSYDFYIKSLSIDPTNAYAKKGIAWITYSYEKNPEEALRILDAIQDYHQSPDYYLLKAEIADYQNHKNLKEKYIKAYFDAIQNPAYGDMYNAYTVEVLINERQDFDQALRIAEKEVNNRPTPLSYDLLAYVYQQKGEYQKALDIAEKHIIDKTYEPLAQYHLAEIYKANDLYDRVTPIKKELLEASYELGPMTTRAIKNL